MTSDLPIGQTLVNSPEGGRGFYSGPHEFGTETPQGFREVREHWFGASGVAQIRGLYGVKSFWNLLGKQEWYYPRENSSGGFDLIRNDEVAGTLVPSDKNVKGIENFEFRELPLQDGLRAIALGNGLYRGERRELVFPFKKIGISKKVPLDSAGGLDRYLLEFGQKVRTINEDWEKRSVFDVGDHPVGAIYDFGEGKVYISLPEIQDGRHLMDVYQLMVFGEANGFKMNGKGLDQILSYIEEIREYNRWSIKKMRTMADKLNRVAGHLYLTAMTNRSNFGQVESIVSTHSP